MKVVSNAIYLWTDMELLKLQVSYVFYDKIGKYIHIQMYIH